MVKFSAKSIRVSKKPEVPKIPVCMFCDNREHGSKVYVECGFVHEIAGERVLRGEREGVAHAGCVAEYYKEGLKNG